MAKRRGVEEEEGLDSLLDTMFNVVGILIIVLVVVQLGMQESVKQIANSVQIDPLALEQLIKDLEEAQKDKLKVEKDLKDLNPDEQNLEMLIQRLQSESVAKEAILKSQQGELQKAIIAQKDALEMAKKADENKEKREKLSSDLNSALEEIAKLEATLDDTPERSQMAAKVVTLPDPRPAPEGIKEASFLLTGNQVYPIVDEPVRDSAKKRSEYQAERGLRKYVKDPKQGIDAEKFVEDFNERPMSDDWFKMEMYAAGRDPRLRFTPKEDAGFKIDEITSPRSRFRRLLSSVDPSKFYFKFIVMPDSYEAYVETRHVTDEMGYLAGWTPVDANWQYTTWVGGKVKFGPEPPPPDPNAPKPAPKPPGPKPNVLD
ncbi:hypothetical protein C5Y96_12585 [Blastopirellula marina]|uniref:Uncharacterized protein n=1 Tax=Blastopirellula marina TaxID=124 RepID=A0A2S8FGG7_9BACT|nr:MULTISPECIES: hypothetical protein [Pirellulaceae]PQO31180.1 hypothetical protein C5Y96_12585 [Blastopirellula marina]RCS51574.1 hypothetical protein DTL36_12595 [Bremerella cremea]